MRRGKRRTRRGGAAGAKRHAKSYPPRRASKTLQQKAKPGNRQPREGPPVAFVQQSAVRFDAGGPLAARRRLPSALVNPPRLTSCNGGFRPLPFRGRHATPPRLVRGLKSRRSDSSTKG